MELWWVRENRRKEQQDGGKKLGRSPMIKDATLTKCCSKVRRFVNGQWSE